MLHNFKAMLSCYGIGMSRVEIWFTCGQDSCYLGFLLWEEKGKKLEKQWNDNIRGWRNGSELRAMAVLAEVPGSSSSTHMVTLNCL